MGKTAANSPSSWGERQFLMKFGTRGLRGSTAFCHSRTKLTRPDSPGSPPGAQCCTSTTPKKQLQEQAGQGAQRQWLYLQLTAGGHAVYQSKEIIQVLKIIPPKEQMHPQEHSIIKKTTMPIH